MATCPGQKSGPSPDVGCVYGKATVPHCPHSFGRMKRIIDLIAVTVASWIAAQNPGMQEAPAPFPAVSCSVGLWCLGVAGDLERRKILEISAVCNQGARS